MSITAIPTRCAVCIGGGPCVYNRTVSSSINSGGMLSKHLIGPDDVQPFSIDANGSKGDASCMCMSIGTIIDTCPLRIGACVDVHFIAITCD